MKLFTHIMINSVVQTLIYLIFMSKAFRINNAAPEWQDFTSLITYCLVLFSVIRLVLYIPLKYPILDKLLPRIGKAYFYFIETFLIIFSFSDAFLYTLQGLHVYDRVVIGTLSNPNVNRVLQIGPGQVITVIVIILLIFIAQIVINKLINSIYLLNSTSRPKKRVIFITSMLPILLLTHFYSLVFYSLPKRGEASGYFPLYSPIKGSPGQEELTVDYNFDESKIPLLSKRPNIIFVMAESFRSDGLTPQLMPQFYSLIKENGCQISPRHFSGGHTSEYGIFAALYGLHGLHYDDFRKEKTPSYPMRFLKKNGYQIIGGSASQLTNWNGAVFMLSEFDQYKEFSSAKIYSDDKQMTKWAAEKLRNSSTPTFMFMFYNSTHHNYFYPKSFEKFRPTIPERYNHLINYDSEEEKKTKIFNRYKNSVSYVDSLLSSFLKEQLSEKQKNTIIVFTGDHGEQFWEEGLLGHGKTSYINAAISVPLVMCNITPFSNGLKFSSHVDIFPTIFKTLEALDLSNLNGVPINSPEIKTRQYSIVTATQFPYNRNKLGLITQNYKFWLKKSSQSLHKMYYYRVTDHNDKNILTGEGKPEFQESLRQFSKDAYKFLKIKK